MRIGRFELHTLPEILTSIYFAYGGTSSKQRRFECPLTLLLNFSFKLAFERVLFWTYSTNLEHEQVSHPGRTYALMHSDCKEGGRKKREEYEIGKNDVLDRSPLFGRCSPVRKISLRCFLAASISIANRYSRRIEDDE